MSTTTHPAGHPAVPLSSPVAWRAATGVVLLAALVQGAAFVQQFAVERGFAESTLACDDTYYYLQTAWNFVRTGRVTFDGVNDTNGVQFLWFWVTVALAAFSETKDALFSATLWLCALLNVACHWPIWRIGRELRRPAVAAMGAALWCCATQMHFVSGMENSINALVFWIALWQMLGAARRIRAGDASAWGLVAPFACLALLVWCRVDQALFAVVGAALLSVMRVAYGGWTRATWRALVSGAAVAGVLAGVMLAGYHWMGGTALPVSGQIKMATYAWSAEYAARLLTGGIEQVISPLLLVQRFVGDSAQSTVAAALGVVLAAGFVAGLGAMRAGDRLGGGAAAWVLGAMSATAVVHVVFLAGLGEYAVYGTWYFAPLLAVVALGAAVAVDVGIGVVSRGSPGPRVALVVACVAAVGVCGWVRHRWLMDMSGDYRERLAYRRIEAARWLKLHLPADARCAAWNAGALAYFSDRPLTNLDGLVNSVGFYRRVLSGERSMTQYLEESGVRYVIDYQFDPAVRAVGTVVGMFEIPKDRAGRRIEVLRLGPAAAGDLFGPDEFVESAQQAPAGAVGPS